MHNAIFIREAIEGKNKRWENWIWTYRKGSHLLNKPFPAEMFLSLRYHLLVIRSAGWMAVVISFFYASYTRWDSFKNIFNSDMQPDVALLVFFSLGVILSVWWFRINRFANKIRNKEFADQYELDYSTKLNKRLKNS
jgi:hypothetical protein